MTLSDKPRGRAPTGALHEFEGEQLTLQQIQKRVPCMSITSIRNALAKGRRTRQAMLCADPRADRRATRTRHQRLAFGLRQQ